MLPWITLDRAEIPGEREPLVLLQRGHEFVIRVGTTALMSSDQHGSEEALAEFACARFAPFADARVLVGGLGMGFTLAATLRVLAPGAHVEVAELLPAVVAWNRGPLAPLAGRPLEDPRVGVRECDVAAAYGEAPAWDAILLDVDNGPDGLSREGNDALYSLDGLRRAHRALRHGGVLGVWSVAPDDAFTRRFAQAGFSVETRVVRARRTRGGRHTLWLGEKRSGRRS